MQRRSYGFVGGVSLIAPNREPAKRHGSDRICAEDDCNTILSMYNRNEFCSIHEEPESVHKIMHPWRLKPGT